MAMYGMDLSHYQEKIDLTKGNYDFCIIKATEGIGFIDKSFDKFAKQLMKLDKLIGCYHYARPDLHDNVYGMEKEAKWFIKQVDRVGLLGKAILVLDWEKEPMDKEYLINAWLDTIRRETGITTFIYGSRSKLKNWQELQWEIMKDFPIWMASWPSTKRFEVGKEQQLHYPDGEWDIWQYSATGQYPEFSGNVDLDLTDMSKETWKWFAAPISKIEGEVITTAMQWCIDNGIFIGDGKGHYMPKEPLTREQAAQIIYTILNKKGD